MIENTELRQKLIYPFTLRLYQLIRSLGKGYPVHSRKQREQLQPLFIIGAGRSGTTLLRSILNNNEQICIPPESHGTIPNCAKKFYRYQMLDWEDLVRILIGEFASINHFDYWELDPQSLIDQCNSLPKEEKTLASIINVIYSTYRNRAAPQAIIWGDKSPFNTLRLRWLHRIFPNARYIHIIRDGRDVVSSYLKKGLITNIESAADRWLLSLKKVEAFEHNKKPQILTIYYEDLVTQTNDTVEKLCRFLGVPFSDKMITGRSADAKDLEMDHMQNVHKAINPGSIGKWKRNLSHTQQTEITRRLTTMLQKHNYA